MAKRLLIHMHQRIVVVGLSLATLEQLLGTSVHHELDEKTRAKDGKSGCI
jgi:hypothetical protein